MILWWTLGGYSLGVLVNWLGEGLPAWRSSRRGKQPFGWPKPRFWLWEAARWLMGGQNFGAASQVFSGGAVEVGLMAAVPFILVVEGSTAAAWQKLIVLPLLVLISLIDLKYRLVFNEILVVMIAMALFFSVLIFGFGDGLKTAFFGGSLAFGLFVLAAWVSPAPLGGGDIKLAFVLGAIFGFPGIFLPLILGTTAGAVHGIVLFSTSGRSQKTQFAYAPSLCAGAAAGLFLNPIFFNLIGYFS